VISILRRVGNGGFAVAQPFITRDPIGAFVQQVIFFVDARALEHASALILGWVSSRNRNP
jgi:hypothetical protein